MCKRSDCYAANKLKDCRFVHARDSRAKLRTTKEMFMAIMSYHQVMPSFLDFVFCFGAQHHAKDFHFIGFRHDTRLTGFEKELAIPELGRSGRTLRLCYSLRSVENSSEQEKWPWSIRSTATHHAFDFETGRTSWLIVKGEGGASMKQRIMTETNIPNGGVLSRYSSRDHAFSSSLSTHLLLCNWSAENWRWYVNYMEEQVQAVTRKTLSVTVKKPSREPVTPLRLARTNTGALRPSSASGRAPKSQQITQTNQNAVAPQMHGQPGSSGLSDSPGPPPRLSTSFHGANHDSYRCDSEFSFEDLQRIEYIEEHANGALLVITLNCKVLLKLVKHYTAVMGSTSCPHHLKSKCAIDFRRFVSQIADISTEIQMQKARVGTLLRLLADRKALVCASPDLEL